LLLPIKVGVKTKIRGSPKRKNIYGRLASRKRVENGARQKHAEDQYSRDSKEKRAEEKEKPFFRFIENQKLVV